MTAVFYIRFFDYISPKKGAGETVSDVVDQMWRENVAIRSIKRVLLLLF